jgi:hypothetical protein
LLLACVGVYGTVSQLMGKLLFEVQPFDPVAFTGAAV